MDAAFTTKIEDTDEGEIRISLAGELDVATAPQVREMVLTLTLGPGMRVILQAGDLTFIDSTGLPGADSSFSPRERCGFRNVCAAKTGLTHVSRS